ncbi:hypothetical protein LEP1GSC061_0225 [Leptospira wolffii serovar Khorat str. Khorat-H2]|nr:hypothetical protein LEP1GSC061_0225 [Leptospira wolffii serovar Khorat str. Khorat-H2]
MFLSTFYLVLISQGIFHCSSNKKETPEEIRKKQFSSLTTFYSGKEGNGFETPDPKAPVVSHFHKDQKIKIIESFTDPRRNLFGWILVQDEFGKESWIRRESIGARLQSNEGIGEIYSPGRVFDDGSSESAHPGENLGLTLEFFLQKGEIYSFGHWEKKKYRQFSVGSKEKLKYFSESRNAVLDIAKARRLGEKDDGNLGCWFGYKYRAKSEIPPEEIRLKDIVYKGDIQPKLITGELQFSIKDELLIDRILKIAEELRPYSKIEEIRRNDDLRPWKCESDHCHTAIWKLPNKTYLFVTLENRTGPGVQSLFLIVSIEKGIEKVIFYHFDQGSETKALFFSRLTDIDGDGVPELWLSDENSQGESFIMKFFLLEKDLLLPLGKRYWTGC